MKLQAWFDESGKGQDPIYVLAGYVAPQTVWQDFAEDWQTELDREPRFPYLHVSESQLFKGYSPQQRIERLLQFVEIIRKHKPVGITYMLKHEEYRQYFSVISSHPMMTKSERRMMQNPYFHGFVATLSLMLLAQGKRREDSGVHEPIEVLFDEGIDTKARLKTGFKDFVDTVRRRTPQFLDLLVNKNPEFRDDKLFLPLQASDLWAWYVRRLCFELKRGNISYQYDPVLMSLREGIEYRDYMVTGEQWADLLLRIRDQTFNILLTGQWGKWPDVN